MNVLRPLLSVIVLMLSAAGWGALVGTLVRKRLSLHEAMLFGSGVLGTITLVIGVFHFSLSLVLGMLGLGLLFLTKSGLCLQMSRDWPCLLPAQIIGGMLLFSGLALPAADTRHDAVRYHLLGPRVWLFEGSIHPLAHESHTAFPALLETLFGMVTSIGGDAAPGALGAVFFFLLVAEIGALSDMLSFSRSTKRCAQVFLAFMPLATNHVDEAFVDIPFAAFVLAGVRCALASQSLGSSTLAGLAFGAACGTKYTGLVALMNVFVILAVDVARRRKPLSDIGRLMLFSLVGAPCYVRNIIQFNTPIFPPPPLISNVLPIRGMTPAEISSFHSAIYTRGMGLGDGLVELLLLPFNVTLFPAWFHGAGGIGLIPLAFAPIGIILSRGKPEARKVLAWTMLSILTWFITQQELRFFLPMAAILTVFAAYAVDEIHSHAPRPMRALAYVTVVTSVIYTGVWSVRVRVSRIASVISPSAAEARWREEVHDSEVLDFLNSDPSVSRVLVLRSSVPAFFLKKPFRIWTPSSGDVLTEAQRFGASHILDSKLGTWVLHAPPGATPIYDRRDARVYLRSELNSGS